MRSVEHALLARNEAYFEGNLVLNDSKSVRAISRPIWMYNPQKERFAWIQTVLLEDSQITYWNGCLCIGERINPLVSRDSALLLSCS